MAVEPPDSQGTEVIGEKSALKCPKSTKRDISRSNKQWKVPLPKSNLILKYFSRKSIQMQENNCPEIVPLKVPSGKSI